MLFRTLTFLMWTQSIKMPHKYRDRYWYYFHYHTWVMNKMVDILQMSFSTAVSWMEMCCILTKISLNLRWNQRFSVTCWRHHIDGLVQERRNSIASAMELRLSCTNPMICCVYFLGRWVSSHYTADMEAESDNIQSTYSQWSLAQQGGPHWQV